MIIYSGKGHVESDAETLLKGGSVMLSFWEVANTSQIRKRFMEIARKRGLDDRVLLGRKRLE